MALSIASWFNTAASSKVKNVERLETANETLRGDVQEMVTAINDLGARRQTLETEISTERQKNERLEQLGNESHNALIAKIEELNQLTNKTQLDRERLHAMERDAARITDEITDFENRLETEHAGEAELAQKQEQIRAQLAQAVIQRRLRDLTVQCHAAVLPRLGIA